MVCCFGAWVDHSGSRSRILDIGTGTGVLALIAAQRNSKATVDAVEIDDAAAEQAAENAAASPWSGRVHVHRMDVRRMHATDPLRSDHLQSAILRRVFARFADDRVGWPSTAMNFGSRNWSKRWNGCWPQEGRWR
jgi:ribosomal protein L11 methylase PrmA